MLKNVFVMILLTIALRGVSLARTLSRTYEPSRNQATLIAKLEAEHGLPKNALRAIIRLESAFNPKAINDKSKIHSYGLGQLTLATAKAHCGLEKKDIFNGPKNGACAAKVLASQYKRYKKNLLLTVLAYNEGTPCVCDGKFFTRNLGKRKVICKEWTKIEEKWSSVPLTCSKDGEVRVTQYYKDFKRFYDSI
jgi:soluble lytic murein transglycosylase-like protein